MSINLWTEQLRSLKWSHGRHWYTPRDVYMSGWEELSVSRTGVANGMCYVDYFSTVMEAEEITQLIKSFLELSVRNQVWIHRIPVNARQA